MEPPHDQGRHLHAAQPQGPDLVRHFNGNYNFGDNSRNPYDTGFGFANARSACTTLHQAANFINGQYRYWNIEVYIQDTWKVTSRLTLDYGLRAAWYQPQFDASLQASTFVLEPVGSRRRRRACTSRSSSTACARRSIR